MNYSTKILGISSFYHDSSAVILEEENIIAAAQEERFTRNKFDSSFPINSINFCLKKSGFLENNLDAIVFYENPSNKYKRIKEFQKKNFPYNPIKNYKLISKWLNEKFQVQNYIEHFLPNFKGKLFLSNHHLSHAASAFYPSPFKESLIVTIDGVGEYACTSIFYGKNNQIIELEQQNYPNSIGLFYSAFTRYLGFKVLSGEYKLMGLAPYGEPIYAKKIKDNLIKISKDGEIELDLTYFDFISGNRMINEKFEKLFENKTRNENELFNNFHMDIAASVQFVLEEIVIKIIKYSLKLYDSKNLCLAGGVALNCVANTKILQNVNNIENIWIQPAAGDAGASLGAAYYALYNNFKKIRTFDNVNDKQKNSLLGTEFSENEIKNTLDSYSINYKKLEKNDFSFVVSELLSEGNIIALFNGKMEFGPRALGSRSIIGDPRDSKMQKKMNLKIKFRESFRPFAPIVLEDMVDDWFEFIKKSKYMLFTAEVKKNKREKINENDSKLEGLEKLKIKRSKIPSVTHVDYSARIQTVGKKDNKKVYEILKAFYDLTDCPILINTSFNVRGEPIVNSPYDALSCYFNTDIDYLVIGDFLIDKKNNKYNFFKELNRKFDAD